MAPPFAPPFLVDDPRIARRLASSGHRTGYQVDPRSADDVDDEVRDWLTQAYPAAPD